MKYSIFAPLLWSLGHVSAAVLPLDNSATPNIAKRQLLSITTPFTMLTQQEFILTYPDSGTPPTPVSGDSNPDPTGTVCSSPSTRVEWRNMAASSRASYISAVKCLFASLPRGIAPIGTAKNRYEEIVWVHQQMTPTIHQDAIFLHWHRYYVKTFESILRQECSYTGPMPWWNEALDSANFAAAPIFTSAYFGSLPAINSDGSGKCVTDGAFANTILSIGPGNNNVPHCLARAWNNTITSQVNAQYVSFCGSRTNYTVYEQCNENGPHALGHNGIGSTMSDVYSSPGDPTFFMHHSFVDHMWNSWQRSNKAFVSQVGGFTTPGCTTASGTCRPMTPDTILSSMGLAANTTVREMMDISRAPLCYGYDS